MPKTKLIQGNCLEKMKDIPDGSVDMILVDLPYGITSNKWDSLIPLDELWEHYLRLGKKNAIYAFTSNQPFTTTLVASAIEIWRHEWVWIKNRGGNFTNTVREPFKEHETVQIFSRGKWTYNKQMQPRTGTGAARVKYDLNQRSKSKNYREFEDREGTKQGKLRVPSSWQKFNTDTSGLHPTIKPVPLFEYLIKTYTNKGDTVLDNCMGSGTTGVACKNLNRNFIGIELDPEYFKIAEKRIKTSGGHGRFGQNDLDIYMGVEKEKQEKEEPSPEELARKFHETYEKYNENIVDKSIKDML